MSVADPRERLTDLTFAMRIITKAFNEDMTILLSQIDQAAPGLPAVRKAAQNCAQLGLQLLRYTKYVEGATKRAPAAAD